MLFRRLSLLALLPFAAVADNSAPTLEEFFRHAEFRDIQISPDGKHLVFSARIAGMSEPWSTNFDLFEVPVDGSAAPKNLTDANDAMDTNPVFSADGKTLFWRAMKRPRTRRTALHSVMT